MIILLNLRDFETETLAPIARLSRMTHPGRLTETIAKCVFIYVTHRAEGRCIFRDGYY